MPQELNGHGPTAGESMGGTGANLNERPDNSTPGGGSNGNAGDRDNGNNNSHDAAYERQRTAILNDPAIKDMLADLKKRALLISPSAEVKLTSIDASGLLNIQVSGMRRVHSLSVERAFQSVRPEIKRDSVFEFTTGEDTATTREDTAFYGTVETGYRLGDYQRGPTGNYDGNNSSAEGKGSLATYSEVLNGKIPPGFWLDNNKVMTEITEQY
ncbi:MAG: hypothetical protein WCD24_17435 [Serratia inhibens]|uniref:hypothetical protein n=1 Tax=Serratia inhibens TaxID=2338073 RepID=UPI003C7A5D87